MRLRRNKFLKDFMYYKLKTFFKPIFFLLALSGLSIYHTSCTPKENQKEISRVLTDRPDGQPDDREEGRTDLRSGTALKCKKNKSGSEEVSVRELDFVDTHNVGEYTLKGKCENTDRLVYITANGYKTNKNPKCNKRRWEITLDLTPLSTENDKIVFHIAHNDETICEEVAVTFQGPKNYIPISPRDDYYENGFYVMKYEAKMEGRGYGAKAVSQAKGGPIVRASHEEALELCRNNGSRYDLITNAQWQNIALFIEEYDENWSEGRSTPSDGNALNCGIFRGLPQAASNNDEDDCGDSFCESGWDEKKRTHWLNSKEKIWDICGNVGEMVKDKYRLDYRFNDFIYNIYSESRLADLFGPKKSYRMVHANRRSNTWNLGYAKIDRGKDLIVRGLPGRDAGVFSVDITRDQDSRRSHSAGNIGFRCVYNP